MNSSSAAKWTVAAGCCLFISLGLLLIPYAGLQNDEVLFATPLYGPISSAYQIHLLGKQIALMVLPYIGTLKTLLYWPILRLLGPGAWTIRVPVLLAGALTIAAFYLFARDVAGGSAGLWAALLLATDPTFLLTDTFDWGPVAIEHLLLVAGCLMITRGRVVSGCFLFGLALWDKAVFLWALSGLVAGITLAYWTKWRILLSDRELAVRAVAAFLIGAFPLLVYNVTRPNATLGFGAHISLESLRKKGAALERALNGSAMFGSVAAEEQAPNPRPPQTRHGRVAVWLREHTGVHRASVFPYAVGLALLGLPVWRRSIGGHAAIFAAAFSVVTFAAMALTRGAGEGVHHHVLIWPFPHLLVAIALAGLPWRTLRLAAGSVVLISSLLVINQYFAQLERNGAEGSFTDALYPLSSSLDSGGRTVYLADWGVYDNLLVLHRGRIDLRPAFWPLIPPAPSEGQRLEIAAMLSNRTGLFVSHAPPREAFPGVGRHLDAAAAAVGLERHLIRVIDDSNGRPVFEVFDFRPAAGARSN